MPDEPHPLPVPPLNSEVEAKASVGRTILAGGCPYKVTGYRPVAELRWELVGFDLPVHPDPSRHPAAG